MSQTTAIIGISSEELRWIRMLVALLRHSDPTLAGTRPPGPAVSLPVSRRGRCPGFFHPGPPAQRPARARSDTVLTLAK